MFWENFQIYGVKIIGKCICDFKIFNQLVFTNAPEEYSPRF